MSGDWTIGDRHGRLAEQMVVERDRIGEILERLERVEGKVDDIVARGKEDELAGRDACRAWEGEDLVAGNRPYSPKRFRSLAILILDQCRQGGIDPRDLWSAMFHADMEAFRLAGKSITGTAWIKTDDGVRPRKRGER